MPIQHELASAAMAMPQLCTGLQVHNETKVGKMYGCGLHAKIFIRVTGPRKKEKFEVVGVAYEGGSSSSTHIGQSRWWQRRTRVAVTYTSSSDVHE
jgi:hypothetical protein